MKIKITAALFFISFSLFASDLPSIKSQDSINFGLDLKYLKDGNIQYFAETFSISDFKKLSKKIIALDFKNYSNDEKNRFVFYKYAFMIPINTNEIFEKNLYTDPNFILANNMRMIEIKFPDENNLLLQKLTLEGRKVWKVSTEPTVFTVQFSEGPNTEAKIQHVLANLEEEKLPKPSIMFCETIRSEQKIFVGGVTVAYYYPVEENKTLVVFFKLAALRPSLIMKAAINLGVASIFFAIEKEDARLTVHNIRQYFKK